MLKIFPLTAKHWVMADQAVVSGTTFVTQFLIARQLGITDYGYFSVMILGQLFLLSLQESAISGVFQVMYHQTKKGDQQKYVNGILSIQYLFLLLVVFGSMAYYHFSKNNELSKYSLVVGLNIVLFLLQDFYRRYFVTINAASKAFLIDAINNIGQLIFLLFFALKNSLTLESTLWICALSFAPAILIALFWAKPKMYNWKQIQYAFSLHYNQSRWMLLSALMQWLSGNFFVVSAGWWLGAAALGALRIGQYLFGFINVFMQAVESYALPKVSETTSNTANTFLYLKTLLLKLFKTAIPIILLIVIFSQPLLRLLKIETTPEHFYVIIGLALTQMVIVFGYPVRIAIRVLKLNRNYFIGYVMATTFSLLTAYIIIHQWQVRGVVVGIFCSQIILVSYWLWVLKKNHFATWKSFISF